MNREQLPTLTNNIIKLYTSISDKEEYQQLFESLIQN